MEEKSEIKKRAVGSTEYQAIKDNAFHPLYAMVDSLRTRHSQRLLQPRHTKKYSKSFLPEAIGLLIHT